MISYASQSQATENVLEGRSQDISRFRLQLQTCKDDILSGDQVLFVRIQTRLFYR